MKRFRGILIICAVLDVIFVNCAMLLIIMSLLITPSQAATGDFHPVVTVAPKVYQPTHVPTATTMPTYTPVPVPSATPDTSLAEAQYKSDSAQIMTGLIGGLNTLHSLSDQASKNPFITKNKEWKDSAFDCLNVIESRSSQLKYLKTPAKYTKLQVWYSKIYDEYSAMASDMRDGIINFDAAAINAANIHLATANLYTNNAIEELKAIEQ